MNTNPIHLPTWAAPLPASRYFDFSQTQQATAFYLWVYESATSKFEELRDAVGPDNIPGEGDGSGQAEEMSERAPQLFNFSDEAAGLVSDPEKAWELATVACNKAIFDFLQTCEAVAEEE